LSLRSGYLRVEITRSKEIVEGGVIEDVRNKAVATREVHHE